MTSTSAITSTVTTQRLRRYKNDNKDDDVDDNVDDDVGDNLDDDDIMKLLASSYGNR